MISHVFSKITLKVPLGEALGSAWGTTYAGALQTHVLTPLGLTHSTLAMAGSPVLAELAPGHVNGHLTGNWNFLAFAPAGALRSSTRDLAKFVQAALGGPGAPLATSFDATLTAQQKAEDLGGEIGLGWWLIKDESPVSYPLFFRTVSNAAFISLPP